jgi:hypothetical protein
MALINKIKGLSKRKKIILSVSAAVIVIAAVAVCILIANNNYLATTMRLLRVEGTVNIEDNNGTSKPVMDNIRFQSGDALNTGSDGLASVSLDDTKIVTLQSDSRAEFRKNRKKLELKLTKGALFFEVTEHLKEDEVFEIETSNMTAGIRGTSGYIYYDEEGREAIVVTDGVVKIIGRNPDTGEVKTAEIRGGEQATVYLFNDRTKDSVEFHLDKLSEDDVPRDIIRNIIDNDQLIDKICADTGWDKKKLLDILNDAIEPSEEITPTPTEAPGETEVTATPTPQGDAEITPTVTPEGTATPTPGGSATPTPAKDAEPTLTPTPVPTPTEEPTPTPTDTDPSGSSWTDPEPTEAPPEPTATPTATPSPTPTSTPTPSPTPAPKIPDRDSIPSGYMEEVQWDEDNLIFIFWGTDDTTGEDGGYIGYVDGKWIKLKYKYSEEGNAVTETYYYTKNGRKVVYYEETYR